MHFTDQCNSERNHDLTGIGMNRRKNTFALLTAVTGAVLTLGLAAPGAGAATVGTQGDVALPCETGLSESDDAEGWATCTNNQPGPVEFRVNLGCSYAVDTSSDWVRLEPGQGAQAVATCPAWSVAYSPTAEAHTV